MQHSLRAMAPGAAAGGTSDGAHQQVSSANRHLGIRERRPVPPAVSGLSVRIAADQAASLMMDGAPQSAPVDGPALGKRKISHDEVIKALRRKVMSKGGALGQAAAAGHEAKAAVEPRRSSLAVITHAETEDEESERRIEVATPSSSSSSSDDSLLPVNGDTRNSGQRHQPHQQQQQQQQRLPSISMMLDGENASSNKPDSDSAAGSGKTRSA
ncbi:hypothetical protein LPJ56_004875 [Coemansia sp. RSA 2599]|nr:hypothetical protein LPJ56_004875 [Coemansia sp. RSA 2599]